MKQLILSLFTMLLVAQVFLSATGVVVHEHHCKKDGTSRSFFISQTHDRDLIQETDNCAKSSCCSSVEKTTPDSPFLQNDTCCSNSTDFIQLDTDLALENTKISLTVLNRLQLSVPVSIVSEEILFTSFHYRGPPPLTNSDRLALIQSYLI